MVAEFDREDRCSIEEKKFLLIQNELDKLANPMELDAVNAAISNGKDIDAAVVEAVKLFARPDDTVEPIKEAETLKDVYKKANEVSSLTEVEVERRYSDLCAKARQAERQRLKAQDRDVFFNRQDIEADFTYWNNKKYWYTEDAVALSLGKNPKFINSKALDKTELRNSPFVAEFKARLKQVKRAIKAGHLTKPVKPALFVNWAEREGLSFPAGWDAKPSNVSAKGGSKNDVNPKEKRVLYRLILGMAIKHYGFSQDYDSKAGDKSQIFTRIENDLRQLKLDVDAKTIRKHLSSALENAIVAGLIKRKDPRI